MNIKVNFKIMNKIVAFSFESQNLCSNFLSQVGFGQYFVQRFVACKTIKDARISMSFGVSMTMLVYAILIPACGLGILAYFRHCDPVQAEIIHKYDSIMPYFMTQMFKDAPGMTGLFISAAYSATMSTISTGLNSCVTVIFKVNKREIYAEIRVVSRSWKNRFSQLRAAKG